MAQRQPQHLRVLRGAKPSRLARAPAPVATGQPPPRPEWLTGQQRELWDWYVGQLRELGLLRPLAAGPLTDLVIATALRDNAAGVLVKEGITAEGRRRGETVKHPAVTAWRTASDVMRKASRDLGVLPPAASPVAPDPEWRDPARLLSPPVYPGAGHPG